MKPFPISVAPGFVDNPPATSRQELLASLDITAEFIGRRGGAARLHQGHARALPRPGPLLRAASRSTASASCSCSSRAPSRSTIPRYQALEAEVDAAVQEINGAYRTKRWKPILYLERHHEHRDIWPFYRHADFCMVTSLHDGMNLVAKEFVSARDDDDGALILSQFTGASARAARRHPREPVRRRRDGRCHPHRGRDGARRAPGAHGADAARRCGSTTSTGGRACS